MGGCWVGVGVCGGGGLGGFVSGGCVVWVVGGVCGGVWGGEGGGGESSCCMVS